MKYSNIFGNRCKQSVVAQNRFFFFCCNDLRLNSNLTHSLLNVKVNPKFTDY